MHPKITEELIALAERHLAEKDHAAAASCLDAATQLDPACLSAHNLRELHRLPGNFSDWVGVKAVVSADDDIYKFFASHPTSLNPMRDYLSDGWRTTLELQQLLEGQNRSLRQCGSFLEFACGHGRFTRHLVNYMAVDNISVSDVVPGSIDFLQAHWPVKGFYSTIAPEELMIPQRYELIFVLSLFSHLPSSTWSAWLQKLYNALEPGGLLIFSTHGEKCARMAGVSLNDEGYAFYASSESSALDGETYGCTYTSPAYVQAQVQQILGSKAAVQITPNHFWGNQDAVILKAT